MNTIKLNKQLLLAVMPMLLVFSCKKSGEKPAGNGIYIAGYIFG